MNGHRSRHPVVKAVVAIPVAPILPFIIAARSLRSIWDDTQSRGILIAAAWLLVTGTIIFMVIEDLSALDAFYFSFITLATIGYGDITPATDLGKIVAVTCAIAGLSILAALFASIGAQKLGPRRRADGRSDDATEQRA